MKLYYHPLSGHSHRARLFLSLLGVDHELIEVDLMKGAQKTREYLAINKFGQVPTLVDGDTMIADSNAILVYLATKLGQTRWLPQSPTGVAAVQRWLSVAAGEIAYGPAAARLITVFGAKRDADEVIGRAHAILKIIDQHLNDSAWLAADHPTIADVALYGYIARAPEGNVDLTDFRNVLAWLSKVEALPGFVEFQKTPAGLTALA